jgi:hypothetical protein
MSETFLIVEKSCDKAPPRNRLMKKLRSSAAFEEFPTVLASEAS